MISQLEDPIWQNTNGKQGIAVYEETMPANSWYIDA